MTLVTVVIPISIYHQAIAEAAISSVQAQTIQCGLIPVLDKDQRGAGWARNHGATTFESDFLYFLDADDQMRPDAVERLLQHYTKRGVYIYSDDWQGDSLHTTPDCGAYLDGTWHTVSALIPTAAFKAIGGFDETLPALEDLDFFLRLQAAGCCGVRCPHPLLSYTPHGQRSKSFKQRPDYLQTKQAIYLRWSEAARMSCGCGTAVSGQIPDSKQDTDVLATALYTPRQMPGPVTGRLYPRPRGTDNYALWIDPKDLDSTTGKTLWSPVKMVDPNAAPAVEDVVRMANEALMAK